MKGCKKNLKFKRILAIYSPFCHIGKLFVLQLSVKSTDNPAPAVKY